MISIFHSSSFARDDSKKTLIDIDCDALPTEIGNCFLTILLLVREDRALLIEDLTLKHPYVEIRIFLLSAYHSLSYIDKLQLLKTLLFGNVWTLYEDLDCFCIQTYAFSQFTDNLKHDPTITVRIECFGIYKRGWNCYLLLHLIRCNQSNDSHLNQITETCFFIFIVFQNLDLTFNSLRFRMKIRN